MTFLYVGIGGALGSLARHGIGLALGRAPGRWPWGTFAVNVLGSLIIGVVMAWFALRGEMDSRWRIALTAGLLGGFTTYSSFAFETVGLIERRHFTVAAAYVTGTLVAAGLACAAGIWLGRGLR